MRFTRVTLFFIAFIITLGFYQLTRNFLSEVEPQTFQATEEVLVDTAQVLAELVEDEITNGDEQTRGLRAAFEGARGNEFQARIFGHLKTRVGIQAYLTDAKGVVIYDSEHGKRVGQDLSNMRDVHRTLKGEYGARSSRDDEADSTSSILYVAAPVGPPDHPLGVLTVYKPQADVLPLIKERQRIIYTACGMIGGGILFLIGAVFLWLFHPIGKITEYAKAIERGERPPKPRIGIGKEVNTLAHALDSMRDALEGRQYAVRYIQTLTHEMKSPLAAIRGAAELLDEDMPESDRHRFLENIRAETSRAERLINRLLELSAIEGMKSLEKSEELEFGQIVEKAIDQAKPLADVAGVKIVRPQNKMKLRLVGDAFILRAAVTNLLENAIDFSPHGGTVHVSLELVDERIVLNIHDEGPGFPDYAKERMFERFYSLRHHASGRKGTGLGLTLVKETAELHGGSITLSAQPGRGTVACLRLRAI
ncbi:two-component system sensor histidine kinase CreC [Luteolibacter pohnpeiensis]|uniref:histidine kinase n=1 Tax=Luteolibacter pohnpeiensis TaxID=454153 RepID=A0A934VWY9_9BACT|nr:two-component system sensor histidine kinase CreC [Luteolibacter pohnpeiensis]MBK1883298.1 two-component system sensor histidine kinase CreC [Luteolibacter pohnpeiensis]